MRSWVVLGNFWFDGSVSDKGYITTPRKMFYEQSRTDLVGSHWSKQCDGIGVGSK